MTKTARREIFPIFLLSIIIIALVSTIGYFQTQIDNLEAQLNSLQNPIYNVSIANVSAGSWWNPVGMTLMKTFYITIKNNGDSDIGGLTFKSEILDNGTVSNSGEFSAETNSPQLGILHANESWVINMDVFTSYSISRAGKSVVVTLMLDEAVLDECTLNLSEWEGV